MCLTQQEGAGTAVRNLLITSQIQQQQQSFMQRHAGMMDSDSDSDSDDDSDDDDGAAAFAALPAAFKQGAMFARAGAPPADPAEQSTMMAPKASFMVRTVPAVAPAPVAVAPVQVIKPVQVQVQPVAAPAQAVVSKSEHEDEESSDEEEEQDEVAELPTRPVMEIKNVHVKAVSRGSFQSLSEMTSFSSFEASGAGDEGSVVSEMTSLTEVTTFSGMSTCDTVDSAFFGELLSDIDDDEDDDSDSCSDEESFFDEAQMQALISCATKQLQPQVEKPLNNCLNFTMPTVAVTKSVLPHKTTSAAVAEAALAAAAIPQDMFASQQPFQFQSPLAQVQAAPEHGPVTWKTISGSSASDGASEEHDECAQSNHRGSSHDSSALCALDWERLASAVDTNNDWEHLNAANAVTEPKTISSSPVPSSCVSSPIKQEVPAVACAVASKSRNSVDKHGHCMTTSHDSQVELQKWDAKMGLRRCHCKTMMDTSCSRKALLVVMGVFVQDFEPPAAPQKRRAKRTVEDTKSIKCEAAPADVTSASAVLSKTGNNKRSLAQTLLNGGISKKLKSLPTLYNPVA